MLKSLLICTLVVTFSGAYGASQTKKQKSRNTKTTRNIGLGDLQISGDQDIRETVIQDISMSPTQNTGQPQVESCWSQEANCI